MSKNYRDTKALYTYDPRGNTLGDEPIFSVTGDDFEDEAALDQHALLGLHCQTDAAATFWFSDKMKALQKTADALLPATINRIGVPARAATPFMLVSAGSDVPPKAGWLFNTGTGALTKLGSAHPDIAPEQMPPKEMVHYRARDGLSIPACPTLPEGRGGKNLPLVALVCGGPYVRGG